MISEDKKNILERLPPSLEQLMQADDDIAFNIGGYICLYLGSIGSIIPIFSAIGSSITNIVTNRRISRIENFLKMLLGDLKDQVNILLSNDSNIERDIVKKIQNEDFEFLFLRSVDSIFWRQRENKAKFYKNLLVHHIFSNKNELDKEEIFLNILDQLSYLELLLLSFFIENKVHSWEGQPPENEEQKRLNLIKEYNLNIEDVNIAMTNLFDKGFFKIKGAYWGEHPFIQQFKHFQGHLSDFAKEFLNYVSEHKTG